MKRRQFFKQLGASSAALSLSAGALANNVQLIDNTIKISANDKVRIGLVGAGIIGHYDVDAALKVAGFEIAAVCDIYTGRLDYAKEKWGDGIFTTRDYRELIARKDIDAVFVCVPDHWHDRISIDALNAGKHVYVEKPMVQKIEFGHAMIAAEKKSGKILQVGSQVASSVLVGEAQKHIASGKIGELAYVEAVNDRADQRGAWQYSIPTDANPQTVDYDRFLGRAPKTPFEAMRVFRWRNYTDYGTGVAGDLVVHLMTSLHKITGSLGPKRIFGLGEVNYWKDGRDAFDLVTSIMDYPQTATHPKFQFFSRVNLASGSGGGGYTKLVGTEGVIEMRGNELKVNYFKYADAPGYGGYDSYTSFSAKQKEEFKKWYEATYANKNPKRTIGEEIVYKTPTGYDDRVVHMTNFYESIRAAKPCIEDASFGLRAAAPALACNMSAIQQKAIHWDAEKMKVTKG
jgi:predicted dehydrogenase